MGVRGGISQIFCWNLSAVKLRYCNIALKLPLMMLSSPNNVLSELPWLSAPEVNHLGNPKRVDYFVPFWKRKGWYGLIKINLGTWRQRATLPIMQGISNINSQLLYSLPTSSQGLVAPQELEPRFVQNSQTHFYFSARKIGKKKNAPDLMSDFKTYYLKLLGSRSRNCRYRSSQWFKVQMSDWNSQPCASVGPNGFGICCVQLFKTATQGVLGMGSVVEAISSFCNNLSVLTSKVGDIESWH